MLSAWNFLCGILKYIFFCCSAKMNSSHSPFVVIVLDCGRSKGGSGPVCLWLKTIVWLVLETSPLYIIICVASQDFPGALFLFFSQKSGLPCGEQHVDKIQWACLYTRASQPSMQISEQWSVTVPRGHLGFTVSGLSYWNSCGLCLVRASLYKQHDCIYTVWNRQNGLGREASVYML